MNSSRNGLTDYYHISLKKLSPHKIALYQRYFLSQTESDNKAKTQIKFQDTKFTSLKASSFMFLLSFFILALIKFLQHENI